MHSPLIAKNRQTFKAAAVIQKQKWDALFKHTSCECKLYSELIRFQC